MQQRYVFARAMKAQVFRLFYMTGNSRQNKASYGFRITNNLSILDENNKKGYDFQTVVNDMVMHSYEVHKVSGKALQTFLQQAGQVTTYLERGFQMRISKAVFEFVQDLEGKVWLIGCKYLDIQHQVP